MANKVAELFLRLVVRDGNDVAVDEDLFEAARFATSVLKQETVTISGSSFQTLTVPTGAKAVIILLGTAVSITLKGITGDTRIANTPSSNPLGLPIILPLASGPSIGLRNGDASAVSIPVIWI